MTTLQLHDEVQLGLQTISSFAVDNFLDEEVSRYLNQAQMEIIKDRYRGLEEAGFEDTTSRVGDLQTLVSTAIMLPVISAVVPLLGSSGEYLIPYPADYMYFISAEGEVTRSENPVINSAEYVPGIKITHDMLKYYRISTYHQPYIRLPGIMFRNDFMHWFVDEDTTMSQARITYIRHPDTIYLDRDDDANSVNPELPEHLHTDIVNLAITLMVGDLQNDPSKRNQLEGEAA